MKQTTEKQLLTVQDVSVILGLGVSTIWRQVSKNNIPKPVRIGGSTRWKVRDIEDWLTSQEPE